MLFFVITYTIILKTPEMIWGVHLIADISTGADTRTLGRFGTMFLYVKHPIVLERQGVYS
jgi:hypothetical protein